ncbi:hypothetical protein SUGI_0102590 [Cryptomeria japonica]|nr:hypothetical protein SUGI_0102590 [Cryptomeria japonica]
MQHNGILANLEAYHALISRFCKENDTEGSLRFYHEMDAECPLQTAFCCSLLLNRLCKEGRMKEACKLLREALKEGIITDIDAYTVVIGDLCKEGCVVEALELCKEMEVEVSVRKAIWKMQTKFSRNCLLRDALTCHALIKGHCKKCQVEAALILFHEMGRKNIVPNVFSYSNIIQGLCHKGRMEEASKLLEEMLDRNLLLGVHAHHGLWSEYCRRWGFVKTNKSLVEPEVEFSFDEYIKILCLQGKILEAGTILRELELMDATYCNSLEIGRLFKDEMEGNMSLHQNRLISESMIRESGIQAAKAAVNEIKRIGYSSDIKVYYMDSIGRFCKEGKMQDALRFYGEMVEKGLVPDFSTYSVLINSLSANNNLQEANKIITEMVELLNN